MGEQRKILSCKTLRIGGESESPRDRAESITNI